MQHENFKTFLVKDAGYIKVEKSLWVSLPRNNLKMKSGKSNKVQKK